MVIEWGDKGKVSTWFLNGGQGQGQYMVIEWGSTGKVNAWLLNGGKGKVRTGLL